MLANVPMLNRTIALLLILAAAGFTAGVLWERADTTHNESTSASGEGAPGRSEATEGSQGISTSAESEKLFGVNPDSPLLIVAALLATLIGTSAVVAKPTASVLAIVAVGALAFAVFDFAEIAHQSNESRTGIAILAAFVAALHLATAAAAGWLASSAARLRRRVA